METAVEDRPSNCFDHLRLIAAFTVLLHHQFYVYQRPWSLDRIDPGAWAVGAFFAISGYLNSRSLLSRRSVAVFLVSRAVRLYPALILCVGATVLLGALVTTRSLVDYFGGETLNYFWRNAGLFFGQRGLLPGVFEQNPVQVTNASLWTLPVEACFYLGLVLAARGLRFQKIALGFCALALCGALLWMSWLSLGNGQIVQLGLMFLTGTMMAALGERIRGVAFFAFTGVVVIVTGIAGGWLLGLSVAVAVAVVTIGRMGSPAALRLPTDISYGVYLFAFPIQQLVCLLGFGFFSGLFVAMLLTFAAALISAYGVEKPALALAERIKHPSFAAAHIKPAV